MIHDELNSIALFEGDVGQRRCVELNLLAKQPYFKICGKMSAKWMISSNDLQIIFTKESSNIDLDSRKKRHVIAITSFWGTSRSSSFTWKFKGNLVMKIWPHNVASINGWKLILADFNSLADGFAMKKEAFMHLLLGITNATPHGSSISRLPPLHSPEFHWCCFMQINCDCLRGLVVGVGGKQQNGNKMHIIVQVNIRISMESQVVWGCQVKRVCK